MIKFDIRKFAKFARQIFGSQSQILELFDRYKYIHARITGATLDNILLQITGDRYVLITSDFFACGGEFEEIETALKTAIESNSLLKNQESVNYFE